MDIFFVIMASFDMIHMVLHDNLFSIYDIHNLIVYHTRINKRKLIEYNQLHLNFSHNNKKLDVSSCMGNIIHSDSFSNIYAFHILTLFRIVYHIGMQLFIHCISPFFKFYHSYI